MVLAYSPDFNPIEMMRSKVKAYLRRVAARTEEALYAAIDYAIRTVTTDDAANWAPTLRIPVRIKL